MGKGTDKSKSLAKTSKKWPRARKLRAFCPRDQLEFKCFFEPFKSRVLMHDHGNLLLKVFKLAPLTTISFFCLTHSLLPVFLDVDEFAVPAVPFDLLLVTGVCSSGVLFLLFVISSSSSSLLSSEKLSSSKSLRTKLGSDSSSSLSSSSRFCDDKGASGVSCDVLWYELR